MTKPEIDMTMKVLTEAKQAGQFRAFWKDFNESVNLMASGEVVIQSMWSPAVTAVRSKGIPCVYQPLKEGYRAWAAGFGVPKTLTARKTDLAIECINWFLRLGRGLSQPPRLLLGRARDHTGKNAALRVGLLDGGQARRTGHQGTRRHSPRKSRYGARRRLLRGTHGCGRL